MRRKTRLLAALFFAAASLPLGFPQSRQSQPGAVPPDVLGPQLVAWSQLQKPQPIPQPLLLPSRPVQQSDHQPPQAANPRSQPQSPAAQVFTGTIVKDGLRYVLKVSSNSVYQLDDQDRAGKYEGKQVKIAGTMDAAGNSLHITSIELVS